MGVRCKFEVIKNDGGGTVVMEPRYDPFIEEDARFRRYTPTGRIELQMTNPRSREFMSLGKKLYVDFTNAE
jgi:hypothetical protein